MHPILRPLARMFARPAGWLAAALLLLVPALSTAEESKPPPPRPALWKVSDTDTTIYLFGTIHALPAGVPWLDGKVADAFDRSQELVTEIVEPDPATLQAAVIKRAVLANGETLRGLLSPPEKANYEAGLATLGLPVQVFDGFEPWYAAVGLSVVPLAQSGFDRDNGVEAVLDARAKAHGMKHAGLETAEYQLDLFDTLPIAAQKRYLAEVVKDLAKMRGALIEMIDAWKRGDSDTLAELMNADEDDPALIDVLLTNRNKAWAGWVKERLKQPGVVFVAVGAGHLAGDGNLRNQLQAGGIHSERVQ